jgi:glycosyltransferase involved in cell wall biosynthesis
VWYWPSGTANPPLSTEKPYILVWLEALLAGGAELQLLGVATDLKATGRRVRIVAHQTPDGVNRAQRLIARHDLECSIIPRPEYGRGFRYLPSLAPTIRELRRYPSASILAALTGPNVSAGLLRRVVGAKRVVWTQHDAGIWRFRRYQERLALSSCTSVVAVSESTKAHLVADLGVKPERVHVIANAARLDPPELSRDEWRHRLAAGPAGPVFVNVANLTANKDHETLLHAWQLLKAGRHSRARDAVLVLAGRPGETGKMVADLSARLGLSDSVRILGAVTDVAGLLDASDVGVLSSRSEGSSVTLLEYCSAQLPVVATDIPAVREADPDGRTVLYAAPGDAPGLAKQLGLLADDEALRARLADYGRVLAGRHDPRRQSQSYLEVLS